MKKLEQNTSNPPPSVDADEAAELFLADFRKTDDYFSQTDKKVFKAGFQAGQAAERAKRACMLNKLKHIQVIQMLCLSHNNQAVIELGEVIAAYESEGERE